MPDFTGLYPEEFFLITTNKFQRLKLGKGPFSNKKIDIEVCVNNQGTKIITYLGVRLYSQYAIPANTRLGSQAAIRGEKFPLVAKTVEKRSDIIKNDAMAIPVAR